MNRPGRGLCDAGSAHPMRNRNRLRNTQIHPVLMHSLAPSAFDWHCPLYAFIHLFPPKGKSILNIIIPWKSVIDDCYPEETTPHVPAVSPHLRIMSYIIGHGEVEINYLSFISYKLSSQSSKILLRFGRNSRYESTPKLTTSKDFDITSFLIGRYRLQTHVAEWRQY